MSDTSEPLAPPEPEPIKAGCAVASLGSVHTLGLADYLEKLDARVRALEREQQAAANPAP